MVRRAIEFKHLCELNSMGICGIIVKVWRLPSKPTVFLKCAVSRTRRLTIFSSLAWLQLNVPLKFLYSAMTLHVFALHIALSKLELEE